MSSPYATRLRRIPLERGEVSIAGGVTRYWTYGSVDAPHTVVAVHGFRGDHHGLEPIVAFLPDMKVIVPDLPGFGRTAPLPRRVHDLDTYVGWLDAFVAEVAPGATILGHSFGSIIASAAVAGGLSAPQLILINPIGSPALKGPKALMTRLAIGYYAAGARLPQRLGTALLRNRLVVRIMSVTMVKSKDPAIRRFAHAQHDTYFSDFADRDVLREAFVTSVSHDVSEVVEQVGVPTLVIAAQHDQITPIEAVRSLVRRFPDAELVEIAGVGHLIHYETPAEAATAIAQFLGVSPRP